MSLAVFIHRRFEGQHILHVSFNNTELMKIKSLWESPCQAFTENAVGEFIKSPISLYCKANPEFACLDQEIVCLISICYLYLMRVFAGAMFLQIHLSVSDKSSKSCRWSRLCVSRKRKKRVHRGNIDCIFFKIIYYFPGRCKKGFLRSSPEDYAILSTLKIALLNSTFTGVLGLLVFQFRFE